VFHVSEGAAKINGLAFGEFKVLTDFLSSRGIQFSDFIAQISANFPE
jgi:hypothetical protein